MDYPITHENDVLIPTDQFGDSSTDAIDLAVASAISGTQPSPDALIAARKLVPDLATISPHPIRKSLVDSFDRGARPSNYFATLNIIGALETLYPELYPTTQFHTSKHPPDTVFTHTVRALDAYHSRAPHDLYGLFGTLTHDIGKPTETPDHHHTETGLHEIHNLVTRLGLEQYQDAMLNAAQHHHKIEEFFTNESTGITRLAQTFPSTDTFSLDQFLLLLEANAAANNTTLQFNTATAKNRVNKAYTRLDPSDS